MERLTRVPGGRIRRTLPGTMVFGTTSMVKFNPNDEHFRTTHGQYHLWQRRPDRSGVRDAATYTDLSRRPWPREGDGRSWLTVSLTDLPRQADMEVSDVQNTRRIRRFAPRHLVPHRLEAVHSNDNQPGRRPAR
jgi:hypothetical protein